MNVLSNGRYACSYCDCEYDKMVTAFRCEICHRAEELTGVIKRAEKVGEDTFEMDIVFVDKDGVELYEGKFIAD